MSCSQALDQAKDRRVGKRGSDLLAATTSSGLQQRRKKKPLGAEPTAFFSNKMTLEKTPLLLFLKEKKYTQRTIWRWRKKKKAEARIFVTRVRRDRWSTRIVQRMTLGVSCGTL